MPVSHSPKILLVGDHPDGRSFAGRILGWLSAGGSPGEVCVAADVGDWRMLTKPEWSLAVGWFAELQPAEEVEAVRKIVDAAPSLPLILCTKNSPALLSEAVEAFIPETQFLAVSRGGEETAVRHWLAVQRQWRQSCREAEGLRRELAASRARESHANEEVRQSRRVKAEFLANVSHEIRTPMNSILGFSQLLRREPLKDAQREKVDFICAAANSLMGLLENLLDFSRLLEGSVALWDEPFQPGKLVCEALKAIQPAAQRKGLRLHCQVEAAVPRCLVGDRNRLRQVLVNLLSNAVKFTDQGTIHIHTAVDEQDEESVVLRVVVTDTGVGIPKDRQEAVFDSFYQADGSLTRRFGGVGLGLALTKQLLDLMGGQIGFRSAASRGSSFWITVPLKHHRTHGEPLPDSRMERQTVLWTSSSGRGDASNRTWRVLVADDEYLHRTLLELLLTRAGCFVDLVDNGREAVEVLRWNFYDVVFMDLQMPKIDGLEAIRQIRGYEQEAGRGRHTRIVALTADAMPGDREKCLAAGADDYLPKPFSVDILLETIHRQIPDFGENAEKRGADREHAVGPACPEDSECPENSLSESLASIDEALKQQDFVALEHCAHALKNLAGRCGDTGAADHAVRIQLAARSRDGRRAAAAVARLRQTLLARSNAATTRAISSRN